MLIAEYLLSIAPELTKKVSMALCMANERNRTMVLRLICYTISSHYSRGKLCLRLVSVNTAQM